LLAEGFAANLSTLKDLQRRCRLTNSEAAKLCGVPLRTYRRWSAHGNPHPGAVRLLALLAGFVPFEGWQGWEFDNGCLFPPGYAKNGLTPDTTVYDKRQERLKMGCDDPGPLTRYEAIARRGLGATLTQRHRPPKRNACNGSSTALPASSW
jgi:hypothetical protein